MTKKKTKSIRHPKNQSGYTHVVLTIIGVAVIAGIITTQIQTTTNYPNRPEQVLGASSDNQFSNVQSRGQVTQEVLASNEINSINSSSITGQNNDIYTFTGTKTYHLFKIVSISTPVTVSISAESGNLLTKQQSLLSSLLADIAQ